MYEKKFDDTKGAIRSCLKRIDNTMAKGKGQKDRQYNQRYTKHLHRKLKIEQY